MMVAAAAVMSPSHRATRVIAAPAAALRTLSCQVRDTQSLRAKVQISTCALILLSA